MHRSICVSGRLISCTQTDKRRHMHTDEDARISDFYPGLPHITFVTHEYAVRNATQTLAHGKYHFPPNLIYTCGLWPQLPWNPTH